VGRGREPATEHKIESWLPERVVTLLAAHGGTGKSVLALCMAVALATGQPYAELACKRSRVLLLSCEDDDLVLRYRLDQLLQALGLTDADLGQQLVVYDMTDRDSVLYAAGREGGHLTPQYEWLKQRIEHHRADVVIIDNASDVFDGNEITRAQVRQFVRSLARLVRDRNGAVLLLAHVDKSTARGSAAGSESYSGSTAWHNSVRSRLFMAEEDGQVVVRHEKANYGPRAPDVHLVRSGAMLLPVNANAIDPAAGLKRDLELKAVLRLLLDFEQRGERVSTSVNAPNNAYRAMSGEKCFPRSITKASMGSVMRELERRRYIAKREERTANRKTVERWAPTSDGLQWLESKGAPSAPSARHVEVGAPRASAPSLALGL
jgi:CheY-like chemotaxis protein